MSEILSAKAKTVRSTYKGKPRCVITITEDGDKVGVNVVFQPSAPTTGTLAPAHALGARILKLLAEDGGQEE